MAESLIFWNVILSYRYGVVDLKSQSSESRNTCNMFICVQVFVLIILTFEAPCNSQTSNCDELSMRLFSNDDIVEVGQSSLTLIGSGLDYCVLNPTNCKLYILTYIERNVSMSPQLMEQNTELSNPFSCDVDATGNCKCFRGRNSEEECKCSCQPGETNDCCIYGETIQKLRIFLAQPVQSECGGPLLGYLACSEIGIPQYSWIGKDSSRIAATSYSLATAVQKGLEGVLLGHVGRIRLISPSSFFSGFSVEQYGKHVIVIKGSGFKGLCTGHNCEASSARAFCNWRDPSTGSHVRTTVIEVTANEAKCLPPNWNHAAGLVEFTLLKGAEPFKVSRTQTFLPFNFTEQWLEMSPDSSDSKGGDVVYINGGGFDIRLSTHAFFHYKVVFSMAKFSLSAYAVPVSSTKLVLFTPKWRHISVKTEVTILKKVNGHWNMVPNRNEYPVYFRFDGFCRSLGEELGLVFSFSIKAANTSVPNISISLSVNRSTHSSFYYVDEIDEKILTDSNPIWSVLKRVRHGKPENMIVHAEETTGFFVVSMIFLVNKRIAVQLEVNAKLGTQLVPSDQVYKHYFKHKFFDDGFCEFCPQTYASGWNFGLGLKVHESGTPDSEGYPSTTVVWGDNSWKQLRVPSFFNNTELLQVTAGRSHACGLRSGNILSCWGVEGDSSLYDKKGTPLISTNIKFVRVSAGAYHTCGIKLDGDVRCWGSNIHDVARPPNSEHRTLREVYRQKWPAWTSNGPFISVDAGISHSCAVEAVSGRIVCWGNNEDNQLGPTPRLSTGTVPFIEGTTAYFGAVHGPFSDVKVGLRFSCGLLVTGFVKCWGRNVDGESCPPKVSASRFSLGLWHACLISSATQKMFCWGRNYSGQVVPLLPLKFSEVSCGESHTCAISSHSEGIPDKLPRAKAHGNKLICWGEAYDDTSNLMLKLPRLGDTKNVEVFSKCIFNTSQDYFDETQPIYNFRPLCECGAGTQSKINIMQTCGTQFMQCVSPNDGACNHNGQFIFSFHDFLWLFVILSIFLCWLAVLLGLESHWKVSKGKETLMRQAVDDLIKSQAAVD